MPLLETAPAPDGLTPEGLVEIAVYDSAPTGSAHGLVILAMRHPYWLLPTEAGVRLMVEPDVAAAARHQLRCFERESVGWPPAPIEAWPGRRVHFFTPLVWAFSVLAVFWLQTLRPELAASGALDAQAVAVRGEWWRAASALFLHADAGHVLSNAAAGVFVFSAVTTTIGILRGWVLVAIAAVTANYLLAEFAAPAPYVSLGASTAIFAGLGVLTGRAVRVGWRGRFGARWKTILLPLGAGLSLLALYGAGGGRIDVGAHLVGFCSGLVVGIVASARRPAGTESIAPR